MRLLLILFLAAAVAGTLAIALGVLGILAGDGSAGDALSRPPRGAPPPPPDRVSTNDFWGKRAELEEEWRWACSVVAWACDVSFLRLPPVRSCTTEEYVEARLDSHYRRHPEDPRPRAELRRRWKWDVAAEIGFVDEGSSAVFLHATGLEHCRIGPFEGVALPRNVRRLVLVHEATHALDHQRFPRLWARDRGLSEEERVFGMLLEGHAWFVTEDVVRAYGWEADYGVFLQLVVVGVTGHAGEDGVTDTHMWEVADVSWDSEARGLRILHAADLLGGRSLIDGILARPPTEDLGTWARWRDWLRRVAGQRVAYPDGA